MIIAKKAFIHSPATETNGGLGSTSLTMLRTMLSLSKHSIPPKEPWALARAGFIFFIGFLCAWALFSMGIKTGMCQTNLPPNISFSADSSNFYFLDRDGSKIYKYNTQGKLTRIYVIKELGKDFLFR